MGYGKRRIKAMEGSASGHKVDTFKQRLVRGVQEGRNCRCLSRGIHQVIK